MRATFVCKAFKDVATWHDDKEPIKQIWFIDIDKFTIYEFNWLIYDWEISGPFTSSFFSELFQYYIL